MSTILDALRKSERERTLVRGPGFADAGRRAVLPADRSHWKLAAIVLLVVLVVTVALLMRMRGVPGHIVGTTLPADSTAREVAPPAPPPIAAPVETTNTAVPEASFLSTLAPEFQQRLPPMTVNIHVYAADEAQRILYINNRPYRRGEEISGGVRVEAIVPDGVVLQYHGQRFKLPRPS
jgi:hypothetical protein